VEVVILIIKIRGKPDPDRGAEKDSNALSTKAAVLITDQKMAWTNLGGVSARSRRSKKTLSKPY